MTSLPVEVEIQSYENGEEEEENKINLMKDFDNQTSNIDVLLECPEWKKKSKHIFILSSAGKPVYSRFGSEDKLVTLFGVMQALVSFVQDGDDVIQAIHSGDNVLVFLSKGPLLLVGVSKKNESVQHMISQLTYVYNQVVSVLTLTQVCSIFEKRRNYDLRRLLTGSERLIDHLLTFTETQPDFLLDSVSCLAMSPVTRELISNAIISACSKVKNLVFAILIAGNKLITLVRMKKYNIKPCDLHLIFNMVSASESFKTAESWTPICLPDFNSSGFLHSHVSYLDESCQACLLLLTVNRDLFFCLSEAKQKIAEKLKKSQCLPVIIDALKKPLLTMDNVNISSMRHFLYKNNKRCQLLAPPMTIPYHTEEGTRHLLTNYRNLHSTMKHKGSELRFLYQQLATEIMFGWVTEEFELYVAFEPLISKPACIEIVKKLLSWIQKEEEKIFILNIPTF